MSKCEIWIRTCMAVFLYWYFFFVKRPLWSVTFPRRRARSAFRCQKCHLVANIRTTRTFYTQQDAWWYSKLCFFVECCCTWCAPRKMLPQCHHQWIQGCQLWQIFTNWWFLATLTYDNLHRIDLPIIFGDVPNRWSWQHWIIQWIAYLSPKLKKALEKKHKKFVKLNCWIL